eukprot:UN06793
MMREIKNMLDSPNHDDEDVEEDDEIDYYEVLERLDNLPKELRKRAFAVSDR